MGFLFGLMMGSMASGSVAAPSIIATIPFRCLSAFEVSEGAYMECRWSTMRQALFDGGCDGDARRSPTGGCSIEQNIKWEIAGLRELKAALDARR